MEFANLAVCSDLLSLAWDHHYVPPNTNTNPLSVTYKVSKLSSNSTTVIAFASALKSEQVKQSLLHSSDSNFSMFEFVCTRRNQSVSIDKTALECFVSAKDQLSLLKDQIDIKGPLIITGVALGGSIASLFTLWLLDTIYLKASKFPLCITFGSPLLGDDAFQRAISERPTWISCFLHVISTRNLVPNFVASEGHMPFGATLFLSESGCACFDEAQSVLELIKAMSLESHEGLQKYCDYGAILKQLKYNASRRERQDGLKCDIINPLWTGIALQLVAIGAINKAEDINEEKISLIMQIEKRLTTIERRKINVHDQTKRLYEAKISMTYLEWYKNATEKEGGYYDSYKTVFSKRREEIVKRQRIVTQYWKLLVEETEKLPKREAESKILSRSLYGGTNYRRMVEPLDIAEYYMIKGNRDYISKGRSEHYKLLEQWEKSGSRSKPAMRNKVSNLTEDTCFWARVEEALIVLEMLVNGDDDRELLIGRLIEFEEYVMGLIQKLAVSVEVFEEKSSFMKWWKEFKQIQGVGYKSQLTSFMNNDKLEERCLTLDEYKKLT